MSLTFSDLTMSQPADNAVYPWIQYKGATFWRTPPIVKNIEEHFRNIRKLDSREDDVLLCTSPKTGTHWLHEIVSMLLLQTTEYNTKGSLMDMHLEFQDMKNVEAVQGQRLLHSHLPISWLPIRHFEKRRKTIYMNRNPKDRHVSWYTYLSGMAGFPKWTWEEFYQEEIVPDKFLTGWFNYTKEMTTAVHNTEINIIQVLYEDLLMEPETQITRIAKYLEVPFTEQLISDVTENCKFENLKEYKIDVGRNFHEEKESKLFRKGIIGDWKNWFTVSQNEVFEDMYRRKMENVDVQFRYEPLK